MTIYTMNGEIVAATHADDTAHLIRRLACTGDISSKDIEKLNTMAESGLDRMSAVIDIVQPERLNEVMHDRFIDNLAKFVGGTHSPTFKRLPTIIQTNIQLSLDTDDILSQACDLWSKASQVDPGRPIYLGTAEPFRDIDKPIVDAIIPGESVQSLTDKIDAEPLAARATISVLLEKSVLTHAKTTLQGEPKKPEASSNEVEVDEEILEMFDPDISPNNAQNFPIQETATLPQESIKDSKKFGKMIRHTNRKIKAITKVVDEATTQGQGRQMVLIAIDGLDGEAQNLFADMTLRRVGTMPPDQILTNLTPHPESTREALLQEALKKALLAVRHEATKHVPSKTLRQALSSASQRRS